MTSVPTSYAAAVLSTNAISDTTAHTRLGPASPSTSARSSSVTEVRSARTCSSSV